MKHFTFSYNSDIKKFTLHLFHYLDQKRQKND